MTQLLLTLSCSLVTIMAPLLLLCRSASAGIVNQQEVLHETTIYPREVKVNPMSSSYYLFSFKVPLQGDILYFDLASSSNDSFCEMTGYVMYSNHLKPASLSVCDGISGIIELDNDKYLNFLPVLEDTTIIKINDIWKTQHILQITDSSTIGVVVDKKEKRSRRTRRGWGSATLTLLNKSGRYVLIYYMTNGQRRYHTRLRINEKIAIVSYAGSTWYAYDRKEQPMLMNNRFQFFVHPSYRNKEIAIKVHARTRYTTEMRLKNLPKMRERFMEVVVIGDATFLNFYENEANAEKYVRALMNSVNRIYRDKTLDTTLHIVLKKVVFERNWYRLRLPENNAKKALRLACKYVFDWKKQYRERFDFGVILTKTTFGVSGYAPVYRMCVEYKSCTLVKDSGFNSAFIIAHEMAHSVGVLHDGDNNRCRNDIQKGSVMSPTIYSTYYRYHWSNCSKITMRENLRYFNCLKDRPSYYQLDTNVLPGTMFDLDQQCRYRMGKGHTACLGRRDPEQYCRYMFCRRPRSRTPGKITCTYWSLAPPDGTICAKGKWCVAGKCLPKGRLTPSPIDGGWSSWIPWGKCKGKCGRGVKFRTRQCNSPYPSYGGKNCSGNYEDWRICNKGACTVNKIFNDQRLEECFKNGRNWDWLQNTDIVMKMSDVDLNCTFENNSTCNWHMGTDKSKFYTFGSGKTPTENTGPFFDHTYYNDTGKYIFLEASYPRRREDTVELISPPLILHTSCLRFYYFMMGDRIGALTVYAEYADKNRKALWNLTGDQGDKWIQAEITLKENNEFKLIIESTVGNNYLGDIAIDDVTATDGACAIETIRNPCSVTCINKKNYDIKYNHTVADGMKCYDERDDMCVKGKCEAVGCDGLKGSKLVTDKCGVCGGDNSTCELVEATIQIKPENLEDVIFKIPSGSLHLEIRKNGTYIGNIGVRATKDTFYYLDPPPFYPWYYFKMARSTFRYHIENTNKQPDKTQRIYADGPTSKTTQLLLIFRSYDFREVKEPIKIEMRYYVITNNNQNIYTWKKYKVTNCSAECGGGTYTTLFECMNLRTNEKVDRRNCSPKNVQPFDVIQPCNTQHCNSSYGYNAEPWSKCGACNKMSKQHRNVTCMFYEQGQLPKPADQTNCKGLEKPSLEKNCYLYCPYAKKKCKEISKRCPEMIKKGYCRYRSVQLLCCKTCRPFYTISPGSYIIV